jgi:hypothetical protein
VSAGGRIFYNGMFDISEREWSGPASLDYYERETELKDYATDNSIDFSLFTFGPRVSIGIGSKF